jgi:predicted N-acetyltransferase YhbS
LPTTSWRSSDEPNQENKAGTRTGAQLSGVEIRPFGLSDDPEAELDLRRRSFGPIPPADRAGSIASTQRSIEAGEMLGAFDGKQLVGSARFHPMRQWWQGRSMPMAGVAGVKVAPEYRGRGVGRALMTGLIAEIVERGYPVSTLYPATATLYRALGWEVAGGRYQTTVPMEFLARLLAPDPAAASPAGERPEDSAGLRRATAADAAVVAGTLGQVYGADRDFGAATHDPGFIAAWLDDEDHFAYLAEDGFLSYRWAEGHDSVRVEVLAAASAATARAFWQLLGSHATMADQVRAYLAPDDPISWLTREPAAAVRRVWSWMLRLIDVPAAMEARGFPASVEVSAQFELSDDVLPANAGRWRLEVSGGAGKLARVGPLGPMGSVGAASTAGHGGVLRLGARGLAALYAGVPLGTLRRAGLAYGGGQATDDALDSAFGGRPAFMLHAF